MSEKNLARLRRARQTRLKIREVAAARLTVHRTNAHIYAQITTPAGDNVLATASTVEKEVRAQLKHGGNRKVLRARVEQNLGILANIQGNVDQALAHYERSLDAYRECGDQHGCAIAYHNLGMVSADREQFAAADCYFRESLTLAQMTGDVYLRGLCLVNHAEVDVARQRFENARQSAEEALAVFDQLGAPGPKHDAYRVIGMVYRETGRSALAESRLRSAVELAVAAVEEQRARRSAVLADRDSDMSAFAPEIKIGSAHSWTVGFQRALSRDTAMEERYVGTRGVDQWSTLDYNQIRGESLLNNGFLNEFKLAMANLQANNASGASNRRGSFAYFGSGTGTHPLPIYLAYLNGRRDADNPLAYTGGSSTWTNSTLAGRLVRTNPAPGSAAARDRRPPAPARRQGR